jgi:hypothetical protein
MKCNICNLTFETNKKLRNHKTTNLHISNIEDQYNQLIIENNNLRKVIQSTFRYSHFATNLIILSIIRHKFIYI